MPDEGYVAMKVISENHLILFEGVNERDFFCILLLPNGTAPAQQMMCSFKSVAISVVHQAEGRCEVHEHFKERSSFPTTAWMEEAFYHLLLMHYGRGPGTKELLPLAYPTQLVKAQFSECQRSQLKQVRTTGNFENRMQAMYLYCMYTCIAYEMNNCKHKNLIGSVYTL